MIKYRADSYHTTEVIAHRKRRRTWRTIWGWLLRSETVCHIRWKSGSVSPMVQDRNVTT